MRETAVIAHVTGRVQGVWFRAWTKAEAERRALSGWVRNEADGSVTALICGPEADVAEMVSALRQGPPAARVSGVTTQETEAPRTPGFRILR
ncbi:MAG: acylphosphatase [Paracoccaceae bacterium]